MAGRRSSLDDLPEEKHVSAVDEELYDMRIQDRSGGPGPPIARTTTTKDSKSGPFMNLPTEIRLEIYRICLKRQYKILMSKRERQEESPSSPSSASSDISIKSVTIADELVNTVDARLRTHPGRVSRSMSFRNTLAKARHRQRLRSVSSPGNTDPLRRQWPTHFDAWHNRPRLTSDTSYSDVNDFSISEDPLITAILCTNKQVYKEARDILYGENVFELNTSTAVRTFAALHQRSRAHIQHVELKLASGMELMCYFPDILRLSLRHCSGLRNLVVHLAFALPSDDDIVSTEQNALYSASFESIRFLPQRCQIELRGIPNPQFEAIVERHMHCART